MRQLDAFDIERDRAGLLAGLEHLVGIDIEDARLRIDQAADQPGAGDAVDLRPPPRDPEAWPPGREALQRGFIDQRQPSLAPAAIAALEHARVAAFLAQMRGGDLAHLVAGAAGK